MARWISCLKQIVTTRLFGLGIAIIVLPLSAIKNQKPCKLSLKTEAKSVLKANKYSQITMQNGDLYKWLNVTRLDTGNDVNDLPSPSLAYSYSTASHAPFDGISANILTIGIDGYKAQIAFGVSRDSVQVKVRTSYDFVWRGWRSVTLS